MMKTDWGEGGDYEREFPHEGDFEFEVENVNACIGCLSPFCGETCPEAAKILADEDERQLQEHVELFIKRLTIVLEGFPVDDETPEHVKRDLRSMLRDELYRPPLT